MTSTPLPAPLYQGSVNTWECDDGGHLNVRFHFERAMIGLGYFSHVLGLPNTGGGSTSSMLAPLEAHVRFLREARPGAPLVMHGGVVAFGERDATLCLDMRHADGAPASCFTIKVAHVDARAYRAFPWSSRTHAAAAKLRCAVPEHARPRSIDLGKPPSEASLARAVELGATRIGASMATPDQCDAFGRLRGEHFFGRASDSVPNLLAQWRREAAAVTGAEPAGAVVEARLVFRRWPRAGDLIEVFTGVAEVAEKTQRLVHWFCDPRSGAAWASLEAVALTFDTATRKTITPNAETITRMRARAIAIAV